MRLIGVLDGLRLGMSRIPLYSLLFHCRAVGGELRAHPLECTDVGWFTESTLPDAARRLRALGRAGVRRAARRGPRRLLRHAAPTRLAGRAVTIRVERVVVADAEVVAAVRRLVPQLSETAAEPEANDVETVVTSPATTLLVARDDEGPIVGMLTLALFRLPSGVRAWIEDVVVDESARRLGAGRALVERRARARRRRGGDDGRPHVAAVAGVGATALRDDGLRGAHDDGLSRKRVLGRPRD